MAGLGVVRLGKAGMDRLVVARLGLAGHGMARFGLAGMARQGEAILSLAR